MRGFHLWCAFWAISPIYGWIECPQGGLCPQGNTCCSTGEGGVARCLSGNADLTQLGVCCADALTATGCPEGFQCVLVREDEGSSGFCKKNDYAHTELPDTISRYQLCSVPDVALQQVHGLPIMIDNPGAPQLAYLSTMGALDSDDPQILNRQLSMETLVIVVHGSARNVDDYLCCTTAALPRDQQDYANSTMMVVAPWFLAPEDGPVSLYGKSVEPLRWHMDGPVGHTWRYGADAIYANISSYDGVDAILDQVLHNEVRFPNLQKIILVGHSAGGQYTQRFALLSNHLVFSPSPESEDLLSRSIAVRVVVANPKSLCYLDARRLVDGHWIVPDADWIATCPFYDQWEWGFSPGNYIETPYKDRAIIAAGGVEAVIQRYATRDVVYLAGELDVIPNGQCQDEIQGPFRRIRSEHYMAALESTYGRPVHQRFVVADVHHDHCLMFQSPAAHQAFFGTMAKQGAEQMG